LVREQDHCRPPAPATPHQVTFCVQGVCSPLLANICLHYVLDLWAHRWRERQAHGDSIVVRYCDDFIVGFEHQKDAERFQDELRERLTQFGLELHPEKTRLIEFGRHAASNRKRRGEGKPETFDFLGFTHICGRTKGGRFGLKRRTMRQRMRAKLRAVKIELRRRMHLPIPEQGRWLGSVVRGYRGYHGIPGNLDAVASFRTQVTRLWLRTLRRRSQRDRTSWGRMAWLADRWLPPARAVHPWPERRFDARTRGKSPVR
ncbi:MAG: hypothetical protein KKB50_11080, partial [Planctomycetes bacterium]|nr:hypothetical protein [Planctomycetota bacterium]